MEAADAVAWSESVQRYRNSDRKYIRADSHLFRIRVLVEYNQLDDRLRGIDDHCRAVVCQFIRSDSDAFTYYSRVLPDLTRRNPRIRFMTVNANVEKVQAHLGYGITLPSYTMYNIVRQPPFVQELWSYTAEEISARGAVFDPDEIVATGLDIGVVPITIPFPGVLLAELEALIRNSV